MSKRFTDQIRYPNARWALTLQDIRIVAAFAVWAAILGAAPILIVRAITMA